MPVVWGGSRISRAAGHCQLSGRISAPSSGAGPTTGHVRTLAPEVTAEESTQKASVAHSTEDIIPLGMSIRAQFSAGRNGPCLKETRTLDDNGCILYSDINYWHSAGTTACIKVVLEWKGERIAQARNLVSFRYTYLSLHMYMQCFSDRKR